MDGDMNDIFQKLNSMLSDEETRSNLKNILNTVSSSNASNASTTQNSNTSNNQTDSSSNTFDFDIQTFLKLQNVLQNLNGASNDSRSNLLLSLKPYLRDSKKEKLDQYIKMLNLVRVLEVMGPLGGDSKNDE